MPGARAVRGAGWGLDAGNGGIERAAVGIRMRDAGDAGCGGNGSGRGAWNGCGTPRAAGHLGRMTTNGDAERVDPLERLSAYRLAREAAVAARLDAGEMGRDALMREVGGQLLRAAGSVAANIAEGYSRGTAAERRKFLEYALGSTRECIAWYETAAHADRAERIVRLVSIRRLLLTMIRNTRADTRADRARFER